MANVLSSCWRVVPKSRQQDDIATAQQRWADYKERKNG
jgi:hypothetical protein